MIIKDSDELTNSISDIYDRLKSKSLVKSERNRVDLFAVALNSANAMVIDKTGTFKDLDKDVTGAPLSSSTDVAKQLNALMGISENDLKVEIESRSKFYAAYRFIFRNLPQMNVALKVLTNQIVSPESLTKNLILLKPVSESNDVETAEFTADKQIALRIINDYKLDEYVFMYISKALSDGDCFVEIINPNEVLLTDDKGDEILLESESNTELQLLIESSNSTYSKEEIISVIDSKFEIGTYDLETLVLTESLETTEKSKVLLRTRKPENVVKLHIDGFTLGYLYIKDTEVLGVQETNIYKNFLNTDSRATKEKDNQSITSKFETFLIDKILKKITPTNKKNMVKFIKNNPDLKTAIQNAVNNDSKLNIRFIKPENMQHFMNPSTTSDSEIYGESFINPMLLLIKHYFAVLVATTNFNLSNAMERRKITVEVGSDMDAESAIMEVVRKFKERSESMSGVLDSLEHTTTKLSPTDDIYLPVINGESPVNIDTLPSSQSSLDPEYLNTLKEEILKGLSIPRTLLNESTNSYHTTLSQENSVFAFEILLYQNKFAPQLKSFISKINDVNAEDNSKKGKLQSLSIGFAEPTALMNESKANELNNITSIIEFVSNLATDENGVVMLNKLSLAKTISNKMDWKKIDKLLEEHKITKAGDLLKPNNKNDGGF